MPACDDQPRMIACFDVDGTLAPLNRACSPLTSACLRRLQRAGVRIVLVSGKPNSLLVGFARATGLDTARTAIAGENGCDILLQAMYPAERIAGVVTESTRAALDRAKEALAREFGNRVFYQPNTVVLTAFPAHDTLPPTRIREFLETLELGADVVLHEYSDAVDCAPAHVHKGTAVTALAEKLGYRMPEDVVVVGDGANDAPMLDPRIAARRIRVGDDPALAGRATHTVETSEAGLALIEAWALPGAVGDE